MSSNIDILVPSLPESVSDATVAVWHKKPGDTIKRDEILLEIETDKIMLEVPAPNTGILESILEEEGSIVTSGQTLGRLSIQSIIQNNMKNESQSQNKNMSNINRNFEYENNDEHDVLSPSIRKLIAEHNIQSKNIQGSGVKGRLIRQDVEKYIELEKKVDSYNLKNVDSLECDHQKITNHHRKETRIVMSRLRKKISERLLEVTRTTAMLTTFNEVNMHPIIILRKKYGELFEKKYGIKLGFMSFCVKSVLEGLRSFPDINASIDREEIIHYHYFDISIAVSTPRGLITPVLRNVDTLDISDIEKNIKLLAERGRNGKLTLDELSGGTFTITNGGVFGSLMSTPIINPPQSAILGMHTIKERPMAIEGKMVILPMMYLALSYDHRLIDGKDAVSFLVFIKELLEDPIRLFLKL